jgi:flavin reductase (DIM6/NTAB) family NADH-FMN oxidoreductase RutF
VSQSDDLSQTAASGFDASRFRQVMGHFCTGVTIVTAADAGEPLGLTLQSFTSLSLDPPLISLAVGRGSATWPRIRDVGAFAVNILTEDQEALCRRFASSGGEKFTGVGWKASTTGAPVLDDVLGWVDCRLEAEHDAGDHIIAIARVVDLGVNDDHGTPLLFYRGGFGRFQA